MAFHLGTTRGVPRPYASQRTLCPSTAAPARLPQTEPHSASADDLFALVPQVLTVEEPQTTWVTQTRTEGFAWAPHGAPLPLRLFPADYCTVLYSTFISQLTRCDTP